MRPKILFFALILTTYALAFPQNEPVDYALFEGRGWCDDLVAGFFAGFNRLGSSLIGKKKRYRRMETLIIGSQRWFPQHRDREMTGAEIRAARDLYDVNGDINEVVWLMNFYNGPRSGLVHHMERNTAIARSVRAGTFQIKDLFILEAMKPVHRLWERLEGRHHAV